MVVFLKALSSGQFHQSKVSYSYVDPSPPRYCAVMVASLVMPETEQALLGPAAVGLIVASGPGAGVKRYLYGIGNEP